MVAEEAATAVAVAAEAEGTAVAVAGEMEGTAVAVGASEPVDIAKDVSVSLVDK